MARGIVVIAGSPVDGSAVKSLLSSLPLGFPLPIVVAINGGATAEQLASFRKETRTLLPMKQVEDKDALLPGQVHFAPPDYHVLIERGGVSLTTEAAVQGNRPSLEVLCDSVADAYGAEAIAVALSSSGADGMRALTRIVERGGMALEEGRPAADATASNPDDNARRVLPLADIAMVLCSLRS